MAAARFNTDGSLDKSFGDTGLITAKYKDHTSNGSSVLVQPDDKIILGGNDSYDTDSSGQDFFIERFLSNGTVDNSFGINGQTVTDMGAYDRIVSMVLQQDGKITASGEILVPTVPYYSYEIGVARYTNGGKNLKQIIITKIKKWLQYRNGFIWDYNSNVSSYAVQRSYNGINWKAVSSEQRAMSNSPVNYYEDPSPLSGNNYYRLKTTSTDGAVAYSNVIAVTENANAIKISPNPARNSLHIEGLSSTNKNILSVVDFTGNVAISQQLTANSSSSYNLNIAPT